MQRGHRIDPGGGPGLAGCNQLLRGDAVLSDTDRLRPEEAIGLLLQLRFDVRHALDNLAPCFRLALHDGVFLRRRLARRVDIANVTSTVIVLEVGQAKVVFQNTLCDLGGFPFRAAAYGEAAGLPLQFTLAVGAGWVGVVAFALHLENGVTVSTGVSSKYRHTDISLAP